MTSCPGHGTPEFTHRARMLALCGWEVRSFPNKRKRSRDAPGQQSGASPNSPSKLPGRERSTPGRRHPNGQLLVVTPSSSPEIAGTRPAALHNAEEAALMCLTCGACMGLWHYLRPGSRQPEHSEAPPRIGLSMAYQSPGMSERFSLTYTVNALQ